MFATELVPTTAVRQPRRVMSWVSLAGTGLAAAGVMELAVGTGKRGKPARYVVAELPLVTRDARLFRLTKPEGEPATDGEARQYDCVVAGDGRGHRCECRGYLRWSFRVADRKPGEELTAGCKHLDGLIEIVAGGQLPEAARPEARPFGPEDYGL